MNVIIQNSSLNRDFDLLHIYIYLADHVFPHQRKMQVILFPVSFFPNNGMIYGHVHQCLKLNVTMQQNPTFKQKADVLYIGNILICQFYLDSQNPT